MLGNDLVRQRTTLISGKFTPFLRTHALRQPIGIIRRRRSQSQDLAGMNINQNHAAAFFAQKFISLLLQAFIYRQINPLAEHAPILFNFLHNPPIGVNFQFERTAAAAELFFIKFFNPGFANLEPRYLKQRIIFNIIGRNRRNIPQNMKQLFSERIIAGQAFINDNPRQIRCIKLDF